MSVTGVDAEDTASAAALSFVPLVSMTADSASNDVPSSSAKAVAARENRSEKRRRREVIRFIGRRPYRAWKDEA